jgi:hypothetical protein
MRSLKLESFAPALVPVVVAGTLLLISPPSKSSAEPQLDQSAADTSEPNADEAPISEGPEDEGPGHHREEKEGLEKGPEHLGGPEPGPKHGPDPERPHEKKGKTYRRWHAL